MSADTTLPPIPFREAMLDDAGILTPAWAGWFRQLFTRVGGHVIKESTAASGYTELPNGVYIQWGVTGSLSSGTTNSITFPIAFPTACRQVTISPSGNSASSTAATGHFGTGNYSTTAFDLYNRTSISLLFSYIAVGY